MRKLRSPDCPIYPGAHISISNKLTIPIRTVLTQMRGNHRTTHRLARPIVRSSGVLASSLRMIIVGSADTGTADSGSADSGAEVAWVCCDTNDIIKTLYPPAIESLRYFDAACAIASTLRGSFIGTSS